MKQKKQYNSIPKTMSLIAAVLLLGVGVGYSVDPYAKADDSWISLSGTVSSVSPDFFQLDYGPGLITIEMDDGDMDADGYKLIEGDKVTVYGYVDDDLYETRSIEAGSVYVEGLNTYFYASSADEEGGIDQGYPYFTATVPIVVGTYEVTGTVSSIDGREFTIDTGTSQLKIDTLTMGYNPMDEFGYQKIEKDDRVKVYGDFDVNLFEKNEVDATTIITLDDASRS